jgi:hypothetical protein
MAKAGTVIKCLFCRTDVYRLKQDVGAGMVVSASYFKGIEPYPDPEDGAEAICPNCKAAIVPSVEAIL